MPRQRTLRATFDWSHDLLSEKEKRVYRWLSVFVGGFSLETAEAVCAFDATDAAEALVLESLNSLVDKSLVMSHEGAGLSGRYRLLEPLRHYASDRLEEAQEADAARRSHVGFFLALGDHVYGELRGAGQVAWMARVVEELDNFRACFGWALSHDPSCALQLSVALERYWQINNHAEGREWLNKSLELWSIRISHSGGTGTGTTLQSGRGDERLIGLWEPPNHSGPLRKPDGVLLSIEQDTVAVRSA
jgi:predicted ATPase